jgi:hypothetical protein
MAGFGQRHTAGEREEGRGADLSTDRLNVGYYHPERSLRTQISRAMKAFGRDP